MYIPLSAYDTVGACHAVTFEGLKTSAYQDRLTDLANQVSFKFDIDDLGILTSTAKAMLAMATTRYLNASHGGAPDDGGAGKIIAELAGLINGYRMGVEGALLEPYATIAFISKRAEDPDFAKYRELYDKFKGMNPR